MSLHCICICVSTVIQKWGLCQRQAVTILFLFLQVGCRQEAANIFFFLLLKKKERSKNKYEFIKNATQRSAFLTLFFFTSLQPQKQPPGLLEDYPSGVDPDAECCDVRWYLKADNRSRGTLKRTHPPCQHRTSLSSSAACRLCNSRLKLCLLVLVLLHTVASLTASHNATGLGLPTITPLEESPANEE